jgi:hypothetical protein
MPDGVSRCSAGQRKLLCLLDFEISRLTLNNNHLFMTQACDMYWRPYEMRQETQSR